MENTCKKCGETKDIILFVKDRNTCKNCRSIWHKSHYEITKETVKYRSKLFRLENKEHIKEYNSANYKRIKEVSAIYKAKNKTKICKQRLDKRTENILSLKDEYINNQLKKKGFTNNQITPELIEVQRIIIKTKRLWKTSQI